MNRLLLFNLATDADDPVLGFTTGWIQALARRCQAVDVITMRAGRISAPANVRVWSVRKERGYSEARRTVQFYSILGGLLRHNRYDAAFAHMVQVFALMSAPLLRLARVPLTLWYAHRAVPRSLVLAEKMVNRIVTASPESFRLPSHKLRIIGHGIDTDRFQPLSTARPPDRPFTIVSAGRIAPVKRLEQIVEAFALVRAGGTDARLRLIGKAAPADQYYHDRLRSLASDLGLSAQVEFAGPIAYDQMTDAYQQADIMVNVSATGSVDKAVLEAMACGLPVITSNEAFEAPLEPWADMLLAPADSPVTLAGRIKDLMLMPVEERTTLGLAMRRVVVEQHSLERLMDALIPILRGDA